MRVFLRILAILGWSILGLLATLVTLCGFAGFIGTLSGKLSGVSLDRSSLLMLGNIFEVMAVMVSGLMLLLGILGRLPGTRRQSKGP